MANLSVEADDHSSLSKTPIGNKIQDAALCEMRDFFINTFSDLSAEAKIHEDNMASLKTDIERSKTTNSMLRSRLEEAKAGIGELEREKKELEEKQKTSQKECDDEFDQHKFDEEISLLENKLVWSDDEYHEVDECRVLLEEYNKDLNLYLNGKSLEFCLQLPEVEFLKEEDFEKEKKLESCKESVNVMKEEIARIESDKKDKETAIKRMVKEQKEWVEKMRGSINYQRGSFIEMLATVQDHVEALEDMFAVAQYEVDREVEVYI